MGDHIRPGFRRRQPLRGQNPYQGWGFAQGYGCRRTTTGPGQHAHRLVLVLDDEGRTHHELGEGDCLATGHQGQAGALPVCAVQTLSPGRRLAGVVVVAPTPRSTPRPACCLRSGLRVSSLLHLAAFVAQAGEAGDR